MRTLHPLTFEAYQLLHEGTLALCRAEQQGIRVDLDYCERKKSELDGRIQQLETDFKATNFYRHWAHCTGGKVNINSGDQLGRYLYSVKKITPTKTTENGKGATDDEALSTLNIPELTMLLQVRKLKKVRDTYLEAFIREQVNGIVHPFFNLHTVKTFRSSSDQPNFQNIPKRDKEAMNIVRDALFPREGHQLWEADYSGIEVRIAACYHKDPTMIKYIEDPMTDMHGDMASTIFQVNDFDKGNAKHKHLRQAAKNGFVFPQFYGDYYKNCAINMGHGWGNLPEGPWKKTDGVPLTDSLTVGGHLISKGIKSMQDFIDHIQKIEKHFWTKRFPVYAKWKDTHYEAYIQNGYVDLYTGFRCIDYMSRNDAINYPVQGAAFHCLLYAFTEIDKYLRRKKMDTKLIGQIHDALVLDVNPAERSHVKTMLRSIMIDKLRERFKWINVPIDIEIDAGETDESWAKIKPLKL